MVPHTHTHKHARTPFQISCWRCIIIISSSSSAAAVRHCYCYCYCPVLLLLLLMLGCRQPTYTRAHTRTHRENTYHSLSLSLRQTKLLELSVCLSSFPHKSTFAVDADLHAMMICAALSSSLATSFALARFKYLFSFSLHSASIARYVRLR